MGKRGRECDFTTNSPDSAHLPPNSPDKLCAAAGGSHRHLKLLRPGHLAPPLPCQASRAADPKSALPAFAQVIGKAPEAPKRPPTPGPTPRPRRRLPAYMALSVPRSPARKGCPPRRRQRRSPNSPKELIPVPGGGRAEGRSRRRRKRREVSAANPARELARGRSEKGKRRTTLARVCPARGRLGPGGWARWEGKDRQGPLSGGSSPRTSAGRAGGGARRSAATCPRTAPAAPARGRKSWDELSGAGRARAAGNASGRERREEGAVRVGGDGAGASGRGSPTPGPGSAARGETLGARRGRGGMRLGGRARGRGGRRGKGSPSSRAPGARPWGRHSAGIRGMPGCRSSFCRPGGSRALLMWWLWRRFSKVRAERGGRGETLRSKRRGSGEGKATTATPPSAVPGGGESGEQEKSHLDLRNLQRRGSGGNLPTPTRSKDSPSYLGEPSKQDVPMRPPHRGNRPGERKVASPNRQS